MSNLRYELLSHDDLRMNPLLVDWWTSAMDREPHMLTESSEALVAARPMAYVAYDGFQPVAVSGLFKARTRDHQFVLHENRRVIEVGSSYVEPACRGQGVGKRIMRMCIELAWQRGWVPVSVSTNPIVQHIFSQFGGKLLENDPKLRELQSLLCLCEVVSPDCKLCPLAKGGGWIFYPSLSQRREYSDFHGL